MYFRSISVGVLYCTLSTHFLCAGPISQIIVFGDSLSDNGNAAAALASVGKTLGNYAPNAFTDSPQTSPASTGPYGLWIDQFAAIMKVAKPTPFVVSPGPGGGTLASNPSGTNFAVASALAGNNPAFSPNNYLNPANPAVPGTTNQVALYLYFQRGHASPENLYVFWAGANNIYRSLGNVSSFAQFPATAIAAADAIAANIATLANAGAKYFLWLNLPPLGEIPYVNDNSNYSVR
jgi:outer membrane lipase/esterase